MKMIIIIFLVLQAFIVVAQNKYIAITIDDLPCSNCNNFEIINTTNNKILKKFLKDYKIPAIGFVNERKLYTNENVDKNKVEILKKWLENGFELGNHTFSHINLNNATVQQYEDDILRGEIITRPLMLEYGKVLKYFRHPQLRTGSTLQYKNQLDSILFHHKYITAPVTMDNDEYIFAYCYKKAKEQEDSAGMRMFASEYILYMERIINHYEKLSIDFLGYNIKQILLLHANELNADYLNKVLEILQIKGYQFITIEEALKDDAYKLQEGITPKGLSWLCRWQLAKGIEPTPQPEVPENIQKMFEQYQKKL